MEIIPAINEENIEEAQRKMRIAKEMGAEWVQIDVADGKFGKPRKWLDFERLELVAGLKYGAHLMIDNIDEEIEFWLGTKMDKLIFQVEAAQNPIAIRDRCQEAGKETGLAVLAETSSDFIKAYIKEFDFWQVLAVEPGPSGQEFNKEALKMIKWLREQNKEACISVDGGMNKETMDMVEEAGADVAVVGTFFWENFA